MKTEGSFRFFAFIAVLVLVTLACGGGGPAPTPAPVQQPVQQDPVEPQPVSNAGDLTTFTDENDLFVIEVPADWTYAHNVSDDGLEYYDTFTSPDELALVESLVYDDKDGTAGANKGAYALFLLNTIYSSTGQEGDIRVTSDQIMQDGSERLIWTSKGGGYSGISFLESRGSDKFLFFTVEWVDSAEDQYLDTLNAVIESYRIP